MTEEVVPQGKSNSAPGYPILLSPLAKQPPRSHHLSLSYPERIPFPLPLPPNNPFCSVAKSDTSRPSLRVSFSFSQLPDISR